MEKKLSIVVPAYNEQEVLREFHRRLAAVLDELDFLCEVLYVNDGSTDNTLEVLDELGLRDSRVGILDLSRNFGKEIAMTAGLDYAGGDAVIVIDADLQDPPELIPKLLAEWRGGCDVVYAKRIARDGESMLKRVTAHAFYRVMQRVGKVHLPEDTGDFRLLSRRAVDALKGLRERHRFMKGLFTWIGFPQKAVLYHRDQRFAGDTKWNYWRLWNFALDGITSFTTAPLKVATYAGLITAMSALAYGVVIVVRTMLHGNPVPGYPSLMVVILFLGGMQLITLGIVGEYLARLFDEAKQRPLYLVDDYRAPTILKNSESAAALPYAVARVSADVEGK